MQRADPAISSAFPFPCYAADQIFHINTLFREKIGSTLFHQSQTRPSRSLPAGLDEVEGGEELSD
jgi:hypothetical protein